MQSNIKWGTYWKSIPVLAHSFELIELNAGYGLKAWSEEGFESCNKHIRMFRISLAWNTSQEANLQDIFKRLWLGSDPPVSSERKKGSRLCQSCAIMW